MTTILNRAPNGNFSHPVDGWYQIEPKGYFPAVAGDGRKVLQCIDDQAITSIVNHFNRQAAGGELPHGNEMLIDREHFRHHRDLRGEKDKESLAFGWAKQLRAGKSTGAGSAGIEMQGRWTNTGRQAVDGGDYRFFSTEYDESRPGEVWQRVGPATVPEDIRNRYPDHEFLRPLKLTGLTLTNDHNNKGGRAITVVNRSRTRDAGGHQDAGAKNNFADNQAEVRLSADSKQPTKKQNMKSVSTLLGLSADADEESVHAAVTRLQNRLQTLEPLEPEITRLKNRNTELEGEQCDVLMDAHGLDAERDKARRDKLKPVLISLRNRAERKSFLAECCPVAGSRHATPVQTRLHNRDTNPPGTSVGGTETADTQTATRIMNRANVIRRDSKNQISLATAVRMAQREVETA